MELNYGGTKMEINIGTTKIKPNYRTAKIELVQHFNQLDLNLLAIEEIELK